MLRMAETQLENYSKEAKSSSHHGQLVKCLIQLPQYQQIIVQNIASETLH